MSRQVVAVAGIRIGFAVVVDVGDLVVVGADERAYGDGVRGPVLDLEEVVEDRRVARVGQPLTGCGVAVRAGRLPRRRVPEEVDVEGALVHRRFEVLGRELDLVVAVGLEDVVDDHEREVVRRHRRRFLERCGGRVFERRRGRVLEGGGGRLVGGDFGVTTVAGEEERDQQDEDDRGADDTRQSQLALGTRGIAAGRQRRRRRGRRRWFRRRLVRGGDDLGRWRRRRYWDRHGRRERRRRWRRRFGRGHGFVVGRLGLVRRFDDGGR